MAKLNKKRRKKVLKIIMDEKKMSEIQAGIFFDNLHHWDKKKYTTQVK